MAKKSYLTPNQVAELLMVSPTAIRLWSDKGELNALTTPGGHRRFLPREIEEFARKKGLTLNDGTTQQLRILIVDDDELLTEYIVDLLESLEKEILVETASDGFAAGLKILDFKPQVVILDILMPYMNGVQVCTRLKKNPATQSIRVIAITGKPSASNTEAIIAAGAEVCLAKPIDRNILLAQLGLTQQSTTQNV